MKTKAQSTWDHTCTYYINIDYADIIKSLVRLQEIPEFDIKQAGNTKSTEKQKTYFSKRIGRKCRLA